MSAWGNWGSFPEYKGVLNPWFPEIMINFMAIMTTGLEILFGILLLVDYKLKWVSKYFPFNSLFVN